MSNQENEQYIKGFFRQIISSDPRLTEGVSEDTDRLLKDAESIFDKLLGDMPYVDNPQHVMASSMFFCSTMLAVYLAQKKQGVSAHQFGNQVLELLAASNDAQSAAPNDRNQPTPDFKAASEESQSDAQPNEFVFEVYAGDTDDVDWGMNVKSCAICSLFSKYDAMDLVPYMCATDDVMSDLGHQGLRRTGSIAVGAHQCDFVYKQGGEAKHLSDQYPGKIRIVNQD
jgi:L-2-amino-thiazoline-4-carboxylic acid hydrolase